MHSPRTLYWTSKLVGMPLKPSATSSHDLLFGTTQVRYPRPPQTKSSTKAQAYFSLSFINSNLAIEPPLVYRVLAALFRGLDDYTSDQRGDVGSWIRVACLKGSTSVIISILDEPNPGKWLNVVTFHGLVGKVLKLSAERIDGVRKAAGECLRLLVEEKPERLSVEGGSATWEIPGVAMMRELFVE